jgi:hypothetical protein
MQRLRLEFTQHCGARTCQQTFDVPDITTALVVAEINQAEGVVELHNGICRVARLERLGGAWRNFWYVEGKAA